MLDRIICVGTVVESRFFLFQQLLSHKGYCSQLPSLTCVYDLLIDINVVLLVYRCQLFVRLERPVRVQILSEFNIDRSRNVPLIEPQLVSGIHNLVFLALLIFMSLKVRDK